MITGTLSDPRFLYSLINFKLFSVPKYFSTRYFPVFNYNSRCKPSLIRLSLLLSATMPAPRLALASVELAVRYTVVPPGRSYSLVSASAYLLSRIAERGTCFVSSFWGFGEHQLWPLLHPLPNSSIALFWIWSLSDPPLGYLMAPILTFASKNF